MGYLKWANYCTTLVMTQILASRMDRHLYINERINEERMIKSPIFFFYYVLIENM